MRSDNLFNNIMDDICPEIGTTDWFGEGFPNFPTVEWLDNGEFVLICTNSQFDELKRKEVFEVVQTPNGIHELLFSEITIFIIYHEDKHMTEYFERDIPEKRMYHTTETECEYVGTVEIKENPLI